ncbi:hypothetical protein [Caudoviricetes sp.]|nr:hypothetical protein [Caudoviricetes sp.]
MAADDLDDDEFFNPETYSQLSRLPPRLIASGGELLVDALYTTDEAQEWNESIADEIDYIIPFPGVAQDIQRWIIDEAIYPQPGLAYAASMSALSVLTGRYLRDGNIKGNLMYIAIAESGEGKDFPFQCVSRLVRECGGDEMVQGEMASGRALFEALQESPSMMLHIDEFGNYLKAISASNAQMFVKDILDILTKAYTSAAYEITGKRIKGVPPICIKEPNLVIFGMATEQQVFDGLRSSDLANGSIARYSVVFGKKGLMPAKSTQIIEPPQTLIDKLKDHIERLKKDFYFRSAQLPISEYYALHKYVHMLDVKRKTNSLPSTKKDFIPLYNRAVVRAQQCSMLQDQCQSKEVFDWFFKKEMETIEIFIKKFLHLGADNIHEQQAKLLQARIKEAGTEGISASELVRKTQKIGTQQRIAMLKELEEVGLIFSHKVDIGRQRPSTFYFWRKQ